MEPIHPMRTKLLPAFILAAGCLALAASAQTPAPAAATEVTASPAPSRVIYAPRLPSVPELMNVAAAQGLAVERVDQTANQITVTYKSGSQLSTVVYNLLPAAGSTATTTQVAAAAPVQVATPAQWLAEMFLDGLLPPVGLMPAVHQWAQLSQALREPPRKRQPQIASILL